ncbi:unnamed protein product [Paramecium sonneborni]|uniref:Uncharacterized protein n=1 Tax=Paramecium sonneborni TaxID=65129 RepID=A0A8S1K7C4_9CILI|nr:unnamed protein product [Paramecium sonneborni]
MNYQIELNLIIWKSVIFDTEIIALDSYRKLMSISKYRHLLFMVFMRKFLIFKLEMLVYGYGEERKQDPLLFYIQKDHRTFDYLQLNKLNVAKPKDKALFEEYYLNKTEDKPKFKE